MWHPVYRDRYSLDTIVATLLAGRPYRGLWQAVQAISRLAHAGCSAGELRVTAFNGRLFSPSQARRVRSQRQLDDRVMEQAVLAVSTTPTARHRAARGSPTADLDVEQLGAVYEHVLDYEPAAVAAPAVLGRTRDARKSTGTFYTPRAVTDYLVRRTLEPPVTAVDAATTILSLRILDPAMGSGAFLVAACRYLARAAEEALIREGTWHRHDITAADRAALRREIASRCLFGVDLNPMAVQLARLSLWLATLAADKPLSFLDHHLVAGNSLVGATPDDLRRQPSRGAARRRRAEPLPLFRRGAPVAGVSSTRSASRLRLTLRARRHGGDRARARSGRWPRSMRTGSSLATWSRVLDLWCAGWFWDDGDAARSRRVRRACGTASATARRRLPERVCGTLLEHAEAVAARHRFLHWPLAFPEVFSTSDGRPLATPGFDAVIGNPPWDMVRGDSGDDGRAGAGASDARRLTDFVRESGVYRVESAAARQPLSAFVERALQLVRRGGRIGLVLPSGIVSDAGAAPLRRHLFDRAEVDAITGLDNRDGIFPDSPQRPIRAADVHAGPADPRSIRCRFGITRVDDLERRRRPPRPAGTLTRGLLSRLSGEDDLGIPELHDTARPGDCRTHQRRAFRGSAPSRGWNVQFGRELNASDDRACVRAVHRRAPTRGRSSRASRSSRSASRSTGAGSSWIREPSIAEPRAAAARGSRIATSPAPPTASR